MNDIFGDNSGFCAYASFDALISTELFKEKLPNYLLFMPDCGEEGVIQVWPTTKGIKWWVEFRGPPYSKWDPEAGISEMQRIHDSLIGAHASALHERKFVPINTNHPDWENVHRLVEESNNVSS